MPLPIPTPGAPGPSHPPRRRPGALLRGGWLCLLLATAAVPFPAAAAGPGGDGVDEEPEPSRPGFLLPDLDPEALVVEGRRVRIRPIFAFIGDYTWFDQDEEGLAQIGPQEDQDDLRAARLGLSLRGTGSYAWDFLAAVDYQEKGRRKDEVFSLLDLRLGLPLGPLRLDIGKQKEPFVFEMVGAAANLPQQERVLSPFFVSRNNGLKLSGTFLDQRMTWSAGWFNRALLDDDLDEAGDDWVARVTGLPSISGDGRDYLHLGLGVRRAEASEGVLQFTGRPESNVADRILDTGPIPGDHADQVSLEALWDVGPLAFLVEAVETRVDAPELGDPRFRGGYGQVSWLLTGQSRPYDRVGGFTRAVEPTGRIGAWELVARWSRVDLTDGAVDGGVLDKLYLGVNWWASRQWKIGLGYGDGELDRDGATGQLRSLLVRLQWLY